MSFRLRRFATQKLQGKPLGTIVDDAVQDCLCEAKANTGNNQMIKPKALFCPTCRKVVLATDPDFPFCSDRCRILDLGKWASGGYVISSPIHDPDLLDELEGLQHRENRPTNESDG